jgi:ribosomal protein S18 acetylase RimI-like enzyme
VTGDFAAMVRRAGPGDEDAIRDVRLRAVADSPHAFDATRAAERSRSRSDWKRWLEPGAVFLLGEGPAPRGIVRADPDREDPSRVYVAAVWVRPEDRGTGAADAMVAAAVAWARDAGFRTMRLDVVADDARARRFYERNGFRVTGRRRRRERDGVLEIGMERSLAVSPGAGGASAPPSASPEAP